MAYQETYEQAFNKVLQSVLGQPIIGNYLWECPSEYKPMVGDLVSLSCAPNSGDWQLSWLMEIGVDRYLLRSVRTGRLCWWHNVGLTALKKGRLRDHFKWTDRQFEFDKKFARACKRNYDYTTTYRGVEFDGFKVTCYLGRRFDHEEPPFSASMTFDDFRKVKAGQLNDFYKKVSKELENK